MEIRGHPTINSYYLNYQMPDQKNHTTKHILVATLFILAFAERALFDLGPNFEFVTAFLILSSYYLGAKKSFIATLLLIALTDRVIGNSKIFLFTWSGFLIPALFSINIIKALRHRFKFKIPSLIATGVFANLFFFVWTNFGVWLLDSFGMYERSFSGLVHCFINGLPFLKYQLISTLVSVPTFFGLSKSFLAMLDFRQKKHLSRETVK